VAETRYYTTKEVTEYFRVSRFVLNRAIKSGELVVSKKDGVKNLFSEESIKNYLNIER
jgi:excisionase family DNA binding protein